MSTPTHNIQRSRVIKALSTLLLLSVLSGALYITRGSYLPALSTWFMLDEHIPSHASSHTSSHAHIDPLSDQQVRALKQTFKATEQLRIALSEDRVIHNSAWFEQARGGLTVLLNTSDHLNSLAERALEAIKTLQSSASAPEARAPYALLSEVLFTLAEADPRLQEGWHAFSCPMAEGFPKWFQAHDQLENPYMGQQMLACGEPADWSTSSASPPPPPPVDEIAHYTCPMHPSVQSHEPGACPICHMDLTPVTHTQLNSGEVIVDAQRRQRVGVRTSPVKLRRLRREARLVGELQWDEGQRAEVSARAEGWVEELLVDRVGERVTRGQPLARVYSPAMLATQRELLAAPRGSKLAKAAHERLRLWGMSAWELRAVIKRKTALPRVTLTSPIEGVMTEVLVYEGAHVSVGQALYRLANPRKLWVELEIFEADLPHISEGQHLTLTSPGASSPYTGVIEALYPTISPVSRTARARVLVKNEQGELRPGMLAQASLTLELGETLAVPTDAVMYTGSRALVFTDHGEGRLRPVEVTLGVRTPEWVSVTSGLREGDIVVSSGVFLIAAESRLRSASKHWAPPLTPPQKKKQQNQRVDQEKALREEPHHE